MRLNVWPTSDITKTVIASVSGIDDGADRRDAARGAGRQQDRSRRARRRSASRRAPTDRIAHERRLVVHRLEHDAGRQRLAASAATTRATLSAIASVLPPTCRVMLSSAAGSSVAGDDAHVVLGAQRRPSRRRARAARARRRRSRCPPRVRASCVGDDQILLVVLRAPGRRRCTVVALLDRASARSSYVSPCAASRAGSATTSISRTSLPLHVHAAHARHARDQRLDLIARDVVQRRRVAALEIVRDDREERRRQPLDLDVEPGRQIGRAPGSRAPAPAAARTTMSVVRRERDR